MESRIISRYVNGIHTYSNSTDTLTESIFYHSSIGSYPSGFRGKLHPWHQPRNPLAGDVAGAWHGDLPSHVSWDPGVALMDWWCEWGIGFYPRERHKHSCFTNNGSFNYEQKFHEKWVKMCNSFSLNMFELWYDYLEVSRRVRQYL